MRPLLKWAVIFSAFLERECSSLVIRPGGAFADPSFLHYQSDGWSTFVSSRHLAQVGAYRVTRTGRARNEFLLERVIFKAIDPTGNISSKLLIKPARPMDEGIAGWNVFSAACGFHTHFEECGSRGGHCIALLARWAAR